MVEHEETTTITRPSLRIKVADGLLTSLFKIKPLFNVAAGKARTMMKKRAISIGVDWDEKRAQYENELNKLESLYQILSSNRVEYPEYYLKPFHAYDEGNLSWQAAMEVESAALTVHAQVYTTNKNDLDENGDFQLRDNYHKNMLMMLAKRGYQPKRILDIGCSTGLSTLKLHESFPNAQIIGADLSPYMLAIAKYNLERNTRQPNAVNHISYLHAAGESSSLGRNDVDMVAICLVSHELPVAATRAVFTEANKILPTGGAISIMDMDPYSDNFKRFASNPFAFAAFKSTEPWIQEYVGMDMVQVLRETGFGNVEVMSNSPRHRTIVAYKA